VKVVLVAGARPNFMKIAPLARAMEEAGNFEILVVHTGQHYDEEMSRVFFDELGIPRPDLNLGVGSSSHARQTAEVMIRLEPVLLSERPDLTIVVGDVNSTLAGALTAAKLGLAVAHVEAGLRSFDTTMPEELNRRLTDAVSDLLFVSEPSGVRNLHDEGAAADRIHLVGNVMIDTLLHHRERAREAEGRRSFGLESGGYVLLTLHRPANVDDPEALRGILEALEGITARVPAVFPAHPRTTAALESAGLTTRAAAIPGLTITKPLGYLDFLGLMSDAMAVLTDSGGIQEETTVLGVPCLTLRDNTERPITIEQGTNTLVGNRPARILAAFDRIAAGEAKGGSVPDLWDGDAARRIVEVLVSREGRERWRDT
jgi:UDP-N-acetylglucosamine 2-epimerase (non-hydrolysing)